MRRIPHARDVNQAFKAVKSAIETSLQGLNEAAGQQMAKGDYEGAEALAEKGKAMQAFVAEVEALRQRWRGLTGGGRRTRGENRPTTPLWAYYQPILKALAERGGEATRAELEPDVEKLMGSTLEPADRESMARGRERWQVMIQRARQHLVSEGWLEDGTGRNWCITDEGRRAAKARPNTFRSSSE